MAAQVSFDIYKGAMIDLPKKEHKPRSSSDGSSSQQMATNQFNIFYLLMSAIAQLEDLTQIDTNHQAQLNMEVGTAKESDLAVAYQDLVNKINQALAEEHQSKPWYETLVDVLCDVIAAIATALTGNPAFLIVAIAMTVMSQTGEFTKLTEAIAQGLENLGMSKAAAGVLAAVFVAVIAVAVTLGVGGATGLAQSTTNIASQAARTAEAVEEVAEDASEDAGAAVEAGADNSGAVAKTAFQRFSQGAEKFAQGAANAKKLAVMEFFQTIPQTNLAGYAVEMYTSDPKKQAELWWATLVQDIICVLGALISGISMGADMGPSQLAQKSTSIVDRFPRILMGLLFLQLGSQGSQAYFQAEQGIQKLDQAGIDEDIGHVQKTVTDLQGILTLNNQISKNIQSAYETEMKEYTQLMDDAALANSINGQIAAAISA